MYLWGAWFRRGVHGVSMGCVIPLWGTCCICGVCGSPVGYMMYSCSVWLRRGVHAVSVGCVAHLWGAWFPHRERDVSVGRVAHLWGTLCLCGVHDYPVGCWGAVGLQPPGLGAILGWWDGDPSRWLWGGRGGGPPGAGGCVALGGRRVFIWWLQRRLVWGGWTGPHQWERSCAAVPVSPPALGAPPELR